MSRIIEVEVERTVTYTRKVTVRVEDTHERITDEQAAKRYSPTVFEDEAKAAAEETAGVLTGWEPGVTEYRAVAARQVESAKNIDVQI